MNRTIPAGVFLVTVLGLIPQTYSFAASGVQAIGVARMRQSDVPSSLTVQAQGIAQDAATFGSGDLTNFGAFKPCTLPTWVSKAFTAGAAQTALNKRGLGIELCVVVLNSAAVAHKFYLQGRARAAAASGVNFANVSRIGNESYEVAALKGTVKEVVARHNAILIVMNYIVNQDVVSVARLHAIAAAINSRIR